jgi:hypothetical protein
MIMPPMHTSTTHYEIHLQLIWIMIPIDTICTTISASLLKKYIQLCYDYDITIYNLISIHIH